VLSWLIVVVAIAAVALGLVALVYAARSRIVDDRLLLVAGVLEVATLAQLVVGLLLALGRQTDFERAVFFAYLVTVPFVAPVTTLLALKEKTRSSMAVVAGGAVVVGVLVARLAQIWYAGV
jgi:4-amino-4-deoxy-L-arabinose transferase-like glycosyltransferase